MTKKSSKKEASKNREPENSKKKKSVQQEQETVMPLPAEEMAASLTRAVAATPEGEDPKSFLEAPFSYNMSQNESIILNSGTLQHTVTDFVLPGRNGFDLVMTRRYDSDSSQLQDMNPFYTGSGMTTQTKENVQNKKIYGLGYGWSFVLPSIEVTPVRERQAGVTYDPFLHLEDGRNFTIENGALKEHPFSDVSIEESTGTVTHPYAENATTSYDIIVNYKNGNKDYFKKFFDTNNQLDNYKLVARQDRFGNTILFDIVDYGGMTITDTWGRKVTLSRSSSILTWTLPDTSTVQYTIDVLSSLRLIQVIDQLGRRTRYDYYDPTVYKAVSKYASEQYGDTSNIEFSYLLLKSITHPTGAVTQYEYGIPDGEVQPKPIQLTLNDIGGYKQYFPVLSRKDVADNVEYNNASYSYTLADGGKYITQAKVQMLNEVEETHTFNDQSLLTKKETRHDNVLVLDGIYEYGIDKEKEDYKQLIKEETRQYDVTNATRFLDKTTTYTYTEDKKLDTKSITESYPSQPQLDQVTQFQYGVFSAVTEKSYLKDAATTIYERYELDEALESKVVKYERIYEGEVLQGKSEYIYGSEPQNNFCVIEERRYFTDSGDLDTVETYVSAQYSYDAGQYTHSPVETRIPGIKDADGTALDDIVTSASYDTMGRPISQTDANGNATDITYDVLGRTVKETYAEVDGSRASKQVYYNDAANYITQTDENGWRQRTQYTPLGQVSRVYVSGGIAPQSDDVLLSSYEYDNLFRGIAEYIYDGEGDATEHIRTTTRNTYDRFDRVLTKVIEEVGYTETHEYNDCWPDPDEPGKVWVRQQQTVTGDGTGIVPDLVSASYTDQAGNTVKEYLGYVCTATHTYDKLGNALTHTDALGHTVTNTYDYAGRNLSLSRIVGGETQTTTTQYDTLGNKVAATDFAGNTTTFTYDVAGRQLMQISPFDDERNATVKSYYDGVGNLTAQKTDQGDYWREMGYVYDARNRQTDVYLYEDDGRTSWNRTRYLYDAAGNKIEMQTGYTESSDDYAATRYAYDRFGKVTQVTDALGQIATNIYDKTGRLMNTVDRNGDRTDLTYDAPGHIIKESVTATVGGKQLLSEREHSFAPSGTKLSDTSRETQDSTVLQELVMTYKYDASGRIIEQQDPGNTLKKYAYDLNGNRTRFRLFRNGQGADIDLAYIYDELDRLVEVRNGGLESDPIAGYTYDVNGNRVSQVYPQNQLETTYSYNKANIVTQLVNKKGTDVVSEYSYTYTIDGNQSGKTGPDGTTSYIYDRMGRLTQESIESWHTIAYAYDAFSNRARMEVSGQDGNYVTTYTYDKNNRLLTETKTEDNRAELFHYSYDANGNQIRRERQKARARVSVAAGGGGHENDAADTLDADGTVGHIGFTDNTIVPTGRAVTLDSRHYNGFNQLVRVYRDGSITNFTYRPDALRHSKQTYDGGKAYRPRPTVHYWDGSNIVLETNTNDFIKAAYLRGITLIAQVMGESIMLYLHNAHGDVVQQVNGSGDSAPTYEYDAFGNQKEPNEEDPNPFRYCGEYWDKAIANYVFSARNYDPLSGRFLAEDKVRFVVWDSGKGSDSIDPLSLNLYVYSNNSPSNKKEHEGKFPLFLTAAAIGCVISLATTFVGDLVRGEFSDGRTYLKAAVSGAVGGAVSILPFNNSLITGMAQAAATTMLDYAFDVHDNNVKSTKHYIANFAIETGINTLSCAVAKAVFPTNRGWFKPEKLIPQLIGKYAIKNFWIQGGIESATQTHLDYVRNTLTDEAVSYQESKKITPKPAPSHYSKPAMSNRHVQSSKNKTTLYYIVQPGDSFWSIAAMFLGGGSNWKQVQAAAGRTWIDPGDRLTLVQYH